jgi:hypothetical protein
MLQLWDGADGARAKDKLEVRLAKRVCAGKMTLANAQTSNSTSRERCQRRRILSGKAEDDE